MLGGRGSRRAEGNAENLGVSNGSAGASPSRNRASSFRNGVFIDQISIDRIIPIPIQPCAAIRCEAASGWGRWGRISSIKTDKINALMNGNTWKSDARKLPDGPNAEFQDRGRGGSLQEKSFRIFNFGSQVLTAQGFTSTKYFAFWGNM
jgi:hypothetical protein